MLPKPPLYPPASPERGCRALHLPSEVSVNTSYGARNSDLKNLENARQLQGRVSRVSQALAKYLCPTQRLQYLVKRLWNLIRADLN